MKQAHGKKNTFKEFQFCSVRCRPCLIISVRSLVENIPPGKHLRHGMGNKTRPSSICGARSKRKNICGSRASTVGNHRGPQFGRNAKTVSHKPRFRKIDYWNNFCASGLHGAYVSQRRLVILPKAASIWSARVHLHLKAARKCWVIRFFDQRMIRSLRCVHFQGIAEMCIERFKCFAHLFGQMQIKVLARFGGRILSKHARLPRRIKGFA